MHRKMDLVKGGVLNVPVQCELRRTGLPTCGPDVVRSGSRKETRDAAGTKGPVPQESFKGCF